MLNGKMQYLQLPVQAERDMKRLARRVLHYLLHVVTLLYQAGRSKQIHLDTMNMNASWASACEL